VREHPIFVPHESGHLAAVATLPDGAPRGLVLMLPGASLDETIGSFLLFQRAAARLAGIGVASVRLDYFGLGDSTNDAEAWELGSIDSALGQAESVLAAVRRGLQVDTFAIAALCYGGRVALRMTARPDCAGAVCLGPPLIEQGRWTSLRRRHGTGALAVAIRRSRLMRRTVLRPLRRALSERKTTSLVQGAVKELSHARVLILYGEGEISRDASRLRAARSLNAMGERLDTSANARFGVELLPTDAMAGFDQMPPASQELVLDRVVGWLEETLDARGSGQPAAAREAVPA
jgi:pimeloyl-ACP methyl ester carboxylesterase